MAKKYGAQEYADVVHAIQLINEPISWGNNKFDVTHQFSVDAYWKVKELTTNKDMQIIMHDAFTPLTSWADLPERTSSRNTDGSNKVGIDAHLYQVSNYVVALDNRSLFLTPCRSSSMRIRSLIKTSMPKRPVIGVTCLEHQTRLCPPMWENGQLRLIYAHILMDTPRQVTLAMLMAANASLTSTLRIGKSLWSRL